MKLLYLLILAPATVLAAEEGGSSFPWETIISVAMTLLAALAAGFLAKFKAALRDSQTFLDVIVRAMDDNEITPQEASEILRLAKPAYKSWHDVLRLLSAYKKKVPTEG
jgi:hypothetical protein